MIPILTVTLNPTVDFSTSAETVAPDRKLRCARPEANPGGGGINVSRAIAILGGHSTAFVAVGGPVGDKLVHLLAEAGIGLAPFPAPAETRQSFSVIDRTTGEEYRFVMPGPDWPARAVTEALARIGRAAPRGGIVVLSGSQPPGVPSDFPARLATRIARSGARMILDTSGAPLHRLLAAQARPVCVLRMDDMEAEELAGRLLPRREDSADFAQSLVHQGIAQMVIVARGDEGSVLATATERWHSEAAKVPVQSKVGAGDSFVGGFTLALARGASPERALQIGTAAASSAVMTESIDLCRAADVRHLTPLCHLSRV
ncbi:sugar kinase [Rhodobacter veldkampii DSM 11550]|uniref:Phosphofructokinase n=1 Tax=Phaeovulum veldkampii DSM 11550 TaxID=1185920 RepID=A0A2T4JIA2_9RHOB|nr:1-phosphofructokinase family hexose kinase [Phaeovulum veldkampii]MBK5947331.1 sugar kinase [Phaeovulum veldkampii DSM 11550]PTE17592.1 sugar kinase [Phaeovulum veldkampii DSM 11550]TDQ60241.1 6-phosphofructokinase [Phaeovulum veldkampii DSM 11550]